jgi:hypothetical protein
MKTYQKIISTLGTVALFGVMALPIATNAQYVSTGTGYYYPTTVVAPSVCSSITHYLSYGSSDYSTGGDVTRLQNFLTSQGYLVNTVSTGYFGNATYNAVIRFQAANGISTVGSVGPVTIARISSVSCGGGSYVSPAVPITPIVTPTYPGYGYGYGTISISSISASYAAIGSQVTIYGSGFALTNNTINFGGGSIQNVSSYNGTSITFTVPSTLGAQCSYGYNCSQSQYGLNVVSGSYPISVTNSYGTSNQVAFSVSNYNSGYPYNTGYGQPVINSVQAPTSLSIGQTGTWSVNATDPYNSSLTYSVNWGDQYQYANNSAQSNYNSGYNGQNTTFTHSYSENGTYTVTFTVTDSSGRTAQTSSTVTVGGNTICYNNGYNNGNYNNCGTGYNNGTPSISSISPTQANIGTQVTIYGNGFTSSNNTVEFGQGAIQNLSSYNGTSLTFNVPSYLTQYCASGSYCNQISYPVTNGSYGLSVMNANGTSNQINFTIGYGNSGSNGINLSSASPSSGSVNSQVTLYGSNFSSDETVHFGSSIIQNVYSNGSSLTFYIPSQQNCTYASSGSYGTNCNSSYIATTNGTYPVYVTDQYGTNQSNTIEFMVNGSGTGSNGSINLTSVTPNPVVGSVVTVYGTGFDYSNNTVYINGTEVVSGISSYSNGYIQFTLPQYAGSQYLSEGSNESLTVANSSGNTSNAISFTVGY